MSDDGFEGLDDTDAVAPPPPPPPVDAIVPPPPPTSGLVGSSAPPPPPPPAPVPAPPPGPVPVAATQWRSLRGLTTALTVFLWLAAAAAVFGAVAFALRVHALGEVIDHGLSVDRVQQAHDADDVVGAAVAIMLLVSFVILVLIIIWTYRAAKNNDALGRLYPRLKPGWGIAGWLIPLANAVIPVLILQDLWRGSEASTPRGDLSWRANKGSALIGWYWGVLLLSVARNGLGRANAHLGVTDELRDLQGHDVIAVIGMLATVAAAVLAIQVVRRLAARQEECLRAQQDAWVAPVG